MDLRELAMSYLSVTQESAVAVYPYIGKGDKILADGKATEAMRETLNKLKSKSRVVIGEGEMDEAPMLYIGETLGRGTTEIDLAVDPIDGTTLIANGQGNAITVLAGSKKGTLLHAPDMYMEKIAVGPRAKGSIDISSPIETNIKHVARALNKPMKNLNIMIQNRGRHQELIKSIQKLGASVILFQDVDITGVVATAIEEYNIDMLIGIGGAPEGVISAVAMRSLGGDFQAKLLPENQAQYDRCIAMGISNPDKHLHLNDLVSSDDCFFIATGITDGQLLKGIREKQGSMLQTQTILSLHHEYHFINSVHRVSSQRELVV
ncbi:class II fructose-bisphosphatase (plasmid) [Pseudalkalibacillus hwajinpoensis]|uniref:class II fructose-bisphosphatase n=1 Tax=Guptibacillus hwajinpoensis TaxID=208199 RepID=UPI00325C05FA